MDPVDEDTLNLLLSIGQDHILSNWDRQGGGIQDNQRRLLQQVRSLDKQYPGGLKTYVSNARKLLEDSRAGVNPFEGYIPSVPEGVKLESGTESFRMYEREGLIASYSTGFVLVAGGLGERLGYQGIKISLPSELVTERSFIQLYIDHILAFQERARLVTGKNVVLPLAIMTSGDTHEATVNLLNENHNFGMLPDQIVIVKQEKVPALLDNDARFALEDDNPYEISTKPHGHGDVHSLLISSGVAKKWVENGIDWIVFFQDTNGIVFRCILAALGVSAVHNFEVNSLTVPRRPKEAVGAICKLTRASDNSVMTINVEYNQLDPLLRATVSPDGDVKDDSGYSPYPGNINVLIFHAPSYVKVLERTSGAVPEFVNPKYADNANTKFKKPTRLECMMQDYPKLLSPDSRVGFTQFERWMAFSAVKNNLVDAVDKLKTTGFSESAISGEDDIYAMNCRLLQLGPHVSFDVDEKAEKPEYHGIRVSAPAKVVIYPSFALTEEEFVAKLANSRIVIAHGSTLILDGSGINIQQLELNGSLHLTARNNSTLFVHKLVLNNPGWKFKMINPDDESYDQKYRIRGYVVEKHDACFLMSGTE